MGWLRDLMVRAEPPVMSFGELSRATLDEPVWGDTKKPHPRSLASLLSKLDRGIELEWLADRQAVQFALARVLGCPSSELATAVGATLGDGDRQTRRFRFDEARYVRPLDLLADALPPGLPALLEQPTAWARIWWHAPSGSGRSLVGHWLEARGRAAHVDARDWTDAVAQFPSTGPVFCELHSPSRVPEALARSQLCVAAPFLPEHGPWLIVESEALASGLPHLLQWFERRLPRDGQFRADEAISILEAVPGLVNTLGDVIGIVGLLDEHGVRTFQGKNRRFIAERYVDERLKLAAVDGNADALWLRKRGFEVLVSLARQAALESDLPLDAPRSDDEWLDLVPPELQPGVDREWLRTSLTKTAAPRTARDLDRAIDALPPGAFRVVRALTQSGLLRENGNLGERSLAPGWLRNAAALEATAQLCRSSPLEWGAGLLRPHSANDVTAGVLAAFAADPLRLVDEVLDELDRTQPASVAALELVVRLAGLATLRGQSPGREALRALAKEQRQLLVQTGQGLWPRLRFPTRAPHLLCDAAWQLAWFTILIPVASSEAEVATHFEPLRTLEPEALDALLTGLLGMLGAERSTDEGWLGCLRLLDTLHAQIAPRTDREGPHSLFAVRSFLAGANEGVLVWSNLVELSTQGALLRGAQRELGERWPDTVARAWRSWQEAGFPAAAKIWRALGEGTGAWERYFPDAAVDALMATRPEALLELSLTEMRAEAWDRILPHFEKLPERLQRAVVDAVPSAPALRALGTDEWRPASHHLRRLWHRFPLPLASRVREVAEKDLDRAVELTEPSALGNVESLVDAFAVGFRARRATAGGTARLRTWLSTCIAARPSGWLSAFALLDELEAQEQRLAGAGPRSR